MGLGDWLFILRFPSCIDFQDIFVDLYGRTEWHDFSVDLVYFHGRLLSAIAVTIAVAVAVAIGVAIQAAAIAVVEGAMIFAAPDFICRQCIGGIDKPNSDSLIRDARATSKIEATGISGTKTKPPGPPVAIRWCPLCIG